MRDVVSPDPMDLEDLIAIRDAALAHLLDPEQPFNSRRSKRRLGVIAETINRDACAEYLEANILTRLAKGVPARRVQNDLNHLFQRCMAIGASARFETFKDNLRAAEKQGTNLTGLSYPVSFEHLDEDLVWSQTGAVMELIAQLLGDVWLNSGTLLGSVREGGLIAHDNDVDLAVMLKATCAKTAAAAWIEAFQTLRQAGLDVRAPERNLRVFKFNGHAVKIDLFPAWMEDGDVWIYPHTAGELDCGNLFPLGRCQKSGLAIPKNPQAFLELNYGTGWQTPDPGYVFNWHRANKKYEDFREALYAGGTDWALRKGADDATDV